jgi:bifunctional non-homologous end joining protein LigD
MEYIGFAGTIPDGEYGAGTVKIRDRGTFNLLVWEEDRIEFVLNGGKLTGKYNLIRFKKGGKRAWLVVKSRAA